MKKIYYQYRLTQASPLCITNGEGEVSDLDLLLDRRGLPFLPGSAVAGLLRGMLDGEYERELLFGYMRDAKNGRAPSAGEEEARESRVIVSDACLPASARIGITERDGVGIDEETGTAKNGAKFNFQAVETEAPYTGVLELTCEDGDEEVLLLEGLMERLAAEGVSAGHRTSRGYGKLTAAVREKAFDLSRPAEAEAWLSFDPFADGAFDDVEPVRPAASSSAAHTTYTLGLCLQGTFTVRVYSTEVGGPDMLPLKGRLPGREGVPVIPGTSWAGVFRHRMLELVRQFPGTFGAAEDDVNEWFGSGETKRRSSIGFSETRIEGGSELTVMRTALDRFTMAPGQKALFTSSVWSGGTGTLAVSMPKEAPASMRQLVETCMLDLHCGLLSFGGEGSVGRGTAVITELRRDGKPVTELMGYDWTKGGMV